MTALSGPKSATTQAARSLAAGLFLAVCCLPGTAAAGFPWPPLPTAGDPLRRYGLFAAGLWAAGWLVAAVDPLVRPFRRPDRRAIVVYFGRLAWGIFPLLAAWQIVDPDFLANKWLSLRIAVVWTILAALASRLAGSTPYRRILKWSLVVAADLAALALIAFIVHRGNTTVRLEPLILFVLTLHLGVLLPAARESRLSRAYRLGWLLALFVFADWFLAPADFAGRGDLRSGPAQLILRMEEPLRQAMFAADGRSAFVLPAKAPREFWQVRLADGDKTVLYRSPDEPIALAAQNAERSTLALALQQEKLDRVLVFAADGFAPRGSIAGDGDFRATAIALTDRYMFLSGAGKIDNFYQCPPSQSAANDFPPNLSQCQKHFLPLADPSRIDFIKPFSLALVAEGNGRWRAGGHLILVNVVSGNPLRLADLESELGGWDYDPLNATVFIALPATGGLLAIDGQNLARINQVPLLPGVEFIRIDWSRKLLVAASPREGVLAVHRLRTGAHLARVEIGPGIRSLDYHPESATVLLATARGLVRVRILELPGVLVND